jgi:hypothetical protein
MLIKCESCGGRVSDTAQHCPHCDAPVNQAQVDFSCVECGEPISGEAESCPHCGYVRDSQISEPATQKNPPVFLLVGIASVVLTLFTPRIFVFFPLLFALACAGISWSRRESGWAAGVAIVGCFTAFLIFALNYHPSYQVTYSVTGSGQLASVTYEGPGGTEQEKIVAPWQKTFTALDGKFLYISAQNESETGGELQVSIDADGKNLKSSSSSGEFTIASTSVSCCTAD